MDAKPFFGGVPVAPDVKLLMEHFGTPEPGTMIDHQQIERVLGLKRATNRYRTVTAKWMRELWDERNIRVIGVSGGFRALTATERLDQGERQSVKGTRRLLQSVKEVATTPVTELPPEQVYRHEHLAKTTVMAYAAVKNVQRQYGLALKTAPESLPKPK